VRARKPDAAIESLKKAVDFAPSDPRFSYVLAVAMVGSGRRDEAIRLLDATLKHHPNHANALQALPATCAKPASTNAPPRRGKSWTSYCESESRSIALSSGCRSRSRRTGRRRRRTGSRSHWRRRG
jgi:hypothetical protein